MGLAARAAIAGGDHQRRFRAGLSRHGYRHCQAIAGAARARAASPDRHPRPCRALFGGRVCARCPRPDRRDPRARAIAAARRRHACCTCARCCTAWPNCPAASAEVRAQIDWEAAAQGWPALHAELAQVDPQAAAKIHPNDPQRIQRALEVYRLSGRSISDWQSRTARPSDDVRWLRFALVPRDRNALARTLSARFESMLQAGLLEEVRPCIGAGTCTRNFRPSARSVTGNCGRIAPGM